MKLPRIFKKHLPPQPKFYRISKHVFSEFQNEKDRTRYIEHQLKKQGFDLDKPMEVHKNVHTGDTVYQQA